MLSKTYNKLSIHKNVLQSINFTVIFHKILYQISIVKVYKNKNRINPRLKESGFRSLHSVSQDSLKKQSFSWEI